MLGNLMLFNHYRPFKIYWDPILAGPDIKFKISFTGEWPSVAGLGAEPWRVLGSSLYNGEHFWEKQIALKHLWCIHAINNAKPQ